MKFKLLIFISTFLAGFSLTGQNEMFTKITQGSKLINTNPDSAYTYFKTIQEEALEESDSLMICITHNMIGACYNVKGDYNTSFEYYLRALGIAERNHFKLQEGRIKKNMAQSLFMRRNLSQATTYYEESLAIFRALNDSADIASVLNSYAGVFYEEGNIDEAIAMLEESIVITEAINAWRLRKTAWANLATMYGEKGRYKEAIAIYDKSIQFEREMDNTNHLARGLYNKARLQFKLGESVKARETCQLALQNAKKINLHLISLMCYDLLKNISKEEGNYQLALAETDSFLIIKDSIFGIEKRALAEELDQKYRTQEVIEKNEFLERTNELQQDLIIQKKQQERYLYVVIALIIGVALMITFFAWNRKKLNLKLIEQNAALAAANENKAMLMKELHHRVKNNFQAIKSMIDRHSESDKDELKKKVEALSLVHQKLYRSDDIRTVQSRSYFGFIIDEYEQLFEQEVEIVTDIVNEDIPTEDAISIGLFLTEAINNAFKYGLQSGDNVLDISYSGKKLGIKNNGVSKSQRSGTQYGTTIMKHLAKKLHAHIDVQSEMDSYAVNLIFNK